MGGLKLSLEENRGTPEKIYADSVDLEYDVGQASTILSISFLVAAYCF